MAGESDSELVNRRMVERGYYNSIKARPSNPRTTTPKHQADDDQIVFW